MKKMFGIAFTLALAAILALGSTVSAWDYEDPCVADNDDFINGYGADDGVYETTGGVQVWNYTNLPNEGYSLYRDDVTDTGNLDTGVVLTLTPDKIDLPIMSGPHLDDPTLTYWKMGVASPDTFYWATEPRGYDEPKPSPIIASYIQIWLPDGKFSIQRNGNRRYAPIDVNDGTWRFQLAPNVLVWDGKFGGAAERIIIGEDGQVANDVWFQRGEPIITRLEP